MLIRATKPNFDCLREAAKQLLIWSFNRKQEFHSTCQNDCNSQSHNPNFFSASEKQDRKSWDQDRTSWDLDGRSWDQGKRSWDQGRRSWDQGRRSWDQGRRSLDQDRSWGQSRRPWGQKRWEFKLDDDGLDDEKPFKVEDLKPFEKNYYKPHPNVVNRSESEIKEFYKKHDIQIFGNNRDKCPPPIFSFDELDLPEEARNVIRDLKYTEPTPIQSQTWPIALSGYNMVGVAQTGSGKTLGFVLPGLIHIKHQPDLSDREGPIVLVISPTRELAQQTDRVCKDFARSFRYNCTCVFGGASRNLQMNNLHKSHICIGTPGRLIDFLRSYDLNLSRCTYLVLDEADRLLDMGFEPQIRTILKKMRPDSQILMWSATWPKEVMSLASDYLSDYIGVKFGSSDLKANANITQHVHVCEKFDKRRLLFKLLGEIFQDPNSKVLIYAQTKDMATQLYYLLRREGHEVVLLKGDLSQRRRDASLAAFRSGRSKILVGTDIVGRGLDITDINYVINFDFPRDMEDYVHVIGRTGRGSNLGTAHSFFTQEDARLAKKLINLLEESNQEVNPELRNLAGDRNEDQFYRNRGYRDRYRRIY